MTEYTIRLTRDEMEIAIRACAKYAKVPLMPTKTTTASRDLSIRMRTMIEERKRLEEAAANVFQFGGRHGRS